MTRHGQLYRSDNVPPRSLYYDRGRFGRLFPSLPPFAVDRPLVRNDLLELGQPEGIMDAGDQPPPANPLSPNPNNRDNPDQTAGVTFLGQFLDHDMTFDPTSSLERQVDPEAVSNFRVPALELDNLYGSGRAASPHLYDQSSPGGIKLLIDSAAPRDLPRNSQNTALIGDPRNDENLIISQLHLAFLKFHNAVVDRVLDDGTTNPNEAFDEAQRLVRWHYQWIILHEFLPATVGQDLVDDILKKGRRFYAWRNEPFIPVEFSVAAYRFGHSQVRQGYIANFDGDNGNPFVEHIFNAELDHSVPDPDDLSGGKRAPRRFLDWRTFFDVRPTPASHTAPGSSPKPLAQRNLLRHLTFGLPSGQRVAKAMKVQLLSHQDLSDVEPLGFDNSTPLWFYILREAEETADGRKLGPVGGRIVAEVFIGLLQGDHMSHLRQDPDWTPNLGPDQDFKMADLLRFAGVSE